MKFSTSDLISIENIMADVLLAVNDEDNRKLTPGFYKRQIKKALDLLNFQTFFDERHRDFEIPTSLKMIMPSGIWNIKDMFLYNGDCCEIEQSERVFHKSNFIKSNKGTGYTARNKTNQADVFTTSFMYDDLIHFYNIQNGMIMLSEACANYSKIRIVYNGVASDIDKTKMIPPFAREAVIGYAVERAFFALKSKDKSVRIDWLDAKADLHTAPSRTEYSTWDNAKILLSSMDSKERSDLFEYLSRLNA